MMMLSSKARTTTTTTTITTTTTFATTALTYLGAAYASVQIYKVARFVWRQYLRPFTNLQQRYGGSKSNSSTWAVVTGATSGIGRGCAHVLASQGFNVVLMARTVPDLEELANELQTTYKVETMVVSIDAAECNEQEVNDLVRQLSSKSLGILVNSVGIINDRPTSIEDMDFDLAHRIIRVNCTFPVLLTSKLVPLLKNHAYNTGGHAAIMIVGSLTSSTPFCYQSTYAATKAFHAHWSRCVAAEMPPNIDVLCVRPGLTSSSRMSSSALSAAAAAAAASSSSSNNHHDTGMMVVDATDFAKRALGMLGIPVSVILPYPPHAFMDFLATTIVPERIQGNSIRKMNLQLQRTMDEEAKKKAEEDMDTI